LASGGYSRVTENVPCGHALKEMGKYIVGCKMIVDRVSIFKGFGTELETF